jgi:hypothetical protein
MAMSMKPRYRCHRPNFGRYGPGCRRSHEDSAGKERADAYEEDARKGTLVELAVDADC